VIAGPGEGTRVAINPLVICGECEACRAGRDNLCPDRQIISMPPREGAFAERVVMPERNLVPIPDHVPTEKAALTEPLACGWHAIRLAEGALDRPIAAAWCQVIGAGAIGLGAALVLAARGARETTIVDAHPARREVAAAAGDFRVVAPAAAEGDDDLVIDGIPVSTEQDRRRDYACDDDDRDRYHNKQYLPGAPVAVCSHLSCLLRFADPPPEERMRHPLAIFNIIIT
jgi:L-iditol 2-dehydrogenase